MLYVSSRVNNSLGGVWSNIELKVSDGVRIPTISSIEYTANIEESYYTLSVG